jgi:hypothetical protein
MNIINSIVLESFSVQHEKDISNDKKTLSASQPVLVERKKSRRSLLLMDRGYSLDGKEGRPQIRDPPLPPAIIMLHRRNIIVRISSGMAERAENHSILGSLHLQ